MGDTAGMGARIFDIPISCVRAALWVLEDYTDADRSDRKFYVGEAYENDQTGEGRAEELFDALVSMIPAATFEVWQSANASNDGELRRYSPTHGFWTGTLNHEGGVTVAADEVRDAVAAGTVDLLLGTAWAEEVAALGTIERTVTIMVPAASEDGDDCDSHPETCERCANVAAKPA